MSSQPGSTGAEEEAGQYFKAMAAMAENRVIGRAGRIPWHLADDFRWFKQRTMGQVLVMGRKTFESIGRALPGRATVVLSRGGWSHPDVRVVSALEAIDPAAEAREVFICGGAEVYREALPLCSDLYLTRVKRVVEGDVFFPDFEDRFERVADLAETPEFRVVHYRNRLPQRQRTWKGSRAPTNPHSPTWSS
jgi:dihydrofolate reductase